MERRPGEEKKGLPERTHHGLAHEDTAPTAYKHTHHSTHSNHTRSLGMKVLGVDEFAVGMRVLVGEGSAGIKGAGFLLGVAKTPGC